MTRSGAVGAAGLLTIQSLSGHEIGPFDFQLDVHGDVRHEEIAEPLYKVERDHEDDEECQTGDHNLPPNQFAFLVVISEISIVTEIASGIELLVLFPIASVHSGHGPKHVALGRIVLGFEVAIHQGRYELASEGQKGTVA